MVAWIDTIKTLLQFNRLEIPVEYNARQINVLSVNDCTEKAKAMLQEKWVAAGFG